MRPYKAILFFSFLFLLSPAYHGLAQDRFFKNIHLLRQHSEITLNPEKILVYKDDSKSLSIEDIQNLSQSSFIEANFITRFDQDAIYWIYYRIENRSEQKLSHLLKGGANAKETYYVTTNGETLELKAGYHFPSTERNIAQGYKSKIKLEHPPKTTVDVIVKIESTDGMPIDIAASLEPYEEWFNQRDKVNLFEGVFSGLLLVIIIINIFLFGYTKQSVFLYFAFYSLINLVYFLHAFGILEIWIHPNQPDILPIFWILPILSGSAYFYFAKAFLELKDTHPFWDKMLTWASLSCLAIFVLTSIYIGLTNDIFIPGNVLIYSLGAITLAGLIMLIAINRRPNLIIRYFTLGTVLLLVSVLITVFGKITGQVDEVPLFVQLGLIIELIIFCLGISHKLKRDFENHEITQRSLILQLKNNEKLQLNINEELTEQVAARTQVIQKQNKALDKARKEAEKATKAKSEFLSVMSHEIRTPLNAIISLSHIMEMDNKDEEMQEYIDALKFSAEGLHSLINDVLDYNKIEADKLILESIEFSIIDLLKNIRDSFKYKARNQGIELLIEIGEHMPDRVIGDPTRLTQIFNNLISNALKFTHQGHVHIRAILQGLQDDIATVTFEVNDTGIGIPKDKLETIFEAYEQASNETTRQYGGTGLGLSITQKLLRLMSSEVKIESAEKEGTKLSFTISFKINQAFDLVNLQEETRDKDLMEKRILVVDDNDMSRLVLKRLLINWNAKFEEAEDGETAIQKCLEKKYDLILTDIEMKPISGFVTADMIKQNSEFNSNTPKIAMSGHLSSEFEKEIEKSEFLAWVQKPFEPNDLYRKILKQITN